MENQDHDELIAYLDGELDPAASQQVEQRLKSDPAYRQALGQFERSWDMLDRLPRSTVGENFTRSTLEMVSLAAAEDKQDSPRRVWFDRRTLASIVLVVAIAMLLGYAGGRAIWPDPNRDLLGDLPILEDLDLYEQAGSIDYLRKLADTGLFGDEAGEVHATPGLAVPESSADRQAEIARKTPVERETLLRKLERFEMYAAEERQRLRTIEASLNHDSDGKQLREVLNRYHEWLRTLNSGVREELNDLLDDDRIAHVRQIKHEQTERRKQELKEAPTEPDLLAVTNWFQDFAWQRREALLRTLSDPRRQYIEGLKTEPQRRAILWIWMAQHGGPGHLRMGQIQLTEAELAHLAEQLSAGARDRLDAAGDLPTKRLLILQWVQSSIHHRRDVKALRLMLPSVSAAELTRFGHEELSSAQAAVLEKMPRQTKFRELQSLYFLSADRLDSMSPEEISSLGPAQTRELPPRRLRVEKPERRP
ncbi:MAG TPA: hypothetical protein VMF30_17015 [Pirellulales bacterium]|nr:hypothetical protein [Pirellulales bacterium]